MSSPFVHRDLVAGCSCDQLGISIRELDDLVAHGFGQFDASYMLWVWNRRAITKHLRGLGYRADFSRIRKDNDV